MLRNCHNGANNPARDLLDAVFDIEESSYELQGLFPFNASFAVFDQRSTAGIISTSSDERKLSRNTYRTTRESVFRLRIVLSESRSVIAYRATR